MSTGQQQGTNKQDQKLVDAMETAKPSTRLNLGTEIQDLKLIKAFGTQSTAQENQSNWTIVIGKFTISGRDEDPGNKEHQTMNTQDINLVKAQKKAFSAGTLQPKTAENNDEKVIKALETAEKNDKKLAGTTP